MGCYGADVDRLLDVHGRPEVATATEPQEWLRYIMERGFFRYMLYQPDSHAAGAWASGCRQQLFYYCSCARRIAPRLLRPSKNVYPNIPLLGPVGGGVAESAAAAEPTVLLLFGFDMCAVV